MKDLAKKFHQWIALSKFSTTLYFFLLSALLRKLPAAKFKSQIINSVNSVEWPEVELLPQPITVGTATTFKIIPHFYEFDFEAVANRRLCYEQEVFCFLEKKLEEYDIIIEIGANVGIFTAFFASAIATNQRCRRIYAFEPSRAAYQRLLSNITINSADVQTFNMAIGKETRLANFYEPKGHLTNGSLRLEFANVFAQDVRVNQTVVFDGNELASIIKDTDRCLIKIDVEGAEKEVLQSLENVITTKKPDLVIEVLNTFQEELNELDFLKNTYSFFNITDKGLVHYDQFVSSNFRDYFCQAVYSNSL